MKTTRRYDSGEDVHMRLNNSIVRYKTRPVRVLQHQGLTINLVDLVTGDLAVANISANSPDLDISSPPLGYANVSGNLVYVSRCPARKQKQGILMDELMYHRDPKELGEGYAFTELTTKQIAECISGEHPDLDYVTKSIHNGKWHGGAFHRRMGLCMIDRLVQSLDIRYMCNSIGVYIPKGRVALMTEKMYDAERSAVDILANNNVKVEVVGEINAEA